MTSDMGGDRHCVMGDRLASRAPRYRLQRSQGEARQAGSEGSSMARNDFRSQWSDLPVETGSLVKNQDKAWLARPGLVRSLGYTTEGAGRRLVTSLTRPPHSVFLRKKSDRGRSLQL